MSAGRRACDLSPTCLHDAPAAVDWDAYRKCKTCLQPTGSACVALNGGVAGGRPDGVRTELQVPHAARQPRRGRRRNEPRV